MAVPPTLHIELKDVTNFLWNGWDRDAFIQKVLNGAKDDPLSAARLRLIYAKLDRLYQK